MSAQEIEMWIASAWMAMAQAQDVLSMEVVNVVELGVATPTLTVRALTAGRVSGTLRCADRTMDLSAVLGASEAHVVAIDGLGAGRHRCEGSVRVDATDGSWGEMPLGFEVAILRPIAWSVVAEDLDLAARTLTVRPSRPLRAASLEAVGLGGAVVARATADLTDPGQPTFHWPESEEVITLRVTGTDPDGFVSRLELSPWSYAVEHEDVVFDSGSHAIDPDETPKLEACWKQVTEVLAKYGPVVNIELFVAGYTDTVGTGDANQALSERRARAIASWFATRGFERPIWYRGFGERSLAIHTPDETEEAANRRALYLLAATQPVSEQLPAGAWRPLR